MIIANINIIRQADTEHIVHFKIEVTQAKLLLVDERTPGVYTIKKKFPYLKVVYTNELYHWPPLSKDILVSKFDFPVPDDTKCIIFTSGTTGNPKGNRFWLCYP